MPKTAQLLALGVGGGFLALFCSATAHADNTVLSPGFGDGDCWGYVQQLADTGQLPQNWQCANYSAQIAPANGTITMDASTDEGAAAIRRIWDGLPKDQPITIRGFSEGSGAAVKAVNGIICGDLASCDGAPPPAGTRLVLDGPAYGSTSFLEGPIVAVVEPIVNAFGVPTDLVLPANTERDYSANDVWANGGGRQNPAGLIAQASVLQTDHSVQPANDPHLTFEGPNGEVNNVYDVGTIPVVDPNLPLPELPAPPVDFAP